MSIRLQQMVEALNARVTEQDQRIEALVQQVNELKAAPAPESARETAEKTNPAKPVKLCPKCNESPAYFFHVRSCKGPKQKEQAGDDGTGTSKSN